MSSIGPTAHRHLRTEDCTVVDQKEIRKVIGGTAVGNFMEWYDFGVYGYLAVTMSAVFTEGMSDSAGLLVTLFGFAVSFLVRPLGGLYLGPLGDRIGRQKVLFFTMALIALSTAAIGMLPTAAQVGLWVIVPLYILKMLQGFSAGGEFAGASTYVAEFSPDKSRGYWTSMLNVASYLGFAAGASVVALTTWISTSWGGENAMYDGAWRIPFLTALPLGLIAIWVRFRLPETPGFEAEAEAAAAGVRDDPEDPYSRHGIMGIIRHHWRHILIGMALVAAEGTTLYALTSYTPTYLEEEVGISTLSAAMATVPVLVIMSLSLPYVGRLSDRIGRKKTYGIAVGLTLVLLIPAFLLMQTGDMWAVLLALAIIAVPSAFFVAQTASALPALFPTASRFGAMALTYNVAVSLFGGTTPFICQALVEWTGNALMPAYWIMFFSALAAVALIPMKESARRPLPGSVPVVATEEEARELVEGQDANPDLDVDSMPLVR